MNGIELPFTLIDQAANRFGLDPKLIASIIIQESGGNTYAVRYEPGFRYKTDVAKFARANGITTETESILQQCSLGLMQVMGVVARELEFNRNLLELTSPAVGIYLGCKKLEQLSKKYAHLDDVIASYNAGSPRFKSDKSYVNQLYVNQVKSRL